MDDGSAAGEEPAALSLHGVRYVPADRSVGIPRLDLTVQRDEIVGLVGPSGSGKSTLLRIIAGLQPIDDGLIRIAGRLARGVGLRGRSVLLVQQAWSFPQVLRVLEQVALPAELRRLDPIEPEPPRRSGEGRRRRGLAGLPISLLSSGLRELPVALLLDEPLARQDPPTRQSQIADLLAVQRATGIAVLYATNDHRQVLGMADRIAVLERGRIVQVDPPARLLAAPRSTFVATFLGDRAMRIVSGTVDDDGGVASLRVHGQRLRIPGGLPGALRAVVDRTVLIGARPEHVRPAGAGDPIDQCLTARVDRIDHLGADTRVGLDLGGGDTWAATLPGDTTVAVDDMLSVRVDVRRLSVFEVGGTALWHGADVR